MKPHSGSNLPKFREVQLDFAAHIRHPEQNPKPDGIEARRMKIYVDLFYNNIQNFLANAFPILKRILSEPPPGLQSWPELVRRFVHRHPSSSPYFMEIPQEFLEFFSADTEFEWPTYLLELAHYEWVEMALAVSDLEVPELLDEVSEAFDLTGPLQVSPLIWSLAYRYPVHQIGPKRLPSEEPGQPTYLVVYRRPDDTVHFMKSNPMTHRLLEWVQETQNGQLALDGLAKELPNIDSQTLQEQGLNALVRLHDARIVFTTQQLASV